MKNRILFSWRCFLVVLSTLAVLQAHSAPVHLVHEAPAMSWLALQTPQPIRRGEYRERLGVRRLDSGKIILNRTKPAIHTFSWGARTMAQCVPYRIDRVVSPHQRSGIGFVRLKGEKGPLAVTVHEVKVSNSDKEFEAELVLDHGIEEVRAFLAFRSAADGTWMMSEKLVALSDVTTAEVTTGLIGILNNPKWIHEKGQRRIRIDDKESVVSAASGKVLESDAAKHLNVDGVLEIRSDKSLRIRYVAAKGYDRGRMTDELCLNSIRGERQWRAGEVVSEYAVTVKCVEAEKP
jgi:hypothetical protein